MAEGQTQLKRIRQNLLAIRSGATPAEMSERIRDLCNANGYDPIFELMEMVKNGVKITVKDSDGNEIEERIPLETKELIAIHKEMLQYIYPKLRAVDIQGHIDANINITVKQYDQMFEGKETAVDADFTPLQQVIEENVKKVKEAVANA